MTTITAPPRVRTVALPALLRDIETVLGYRPSDSIALRVRRRRRSFAVLRVDLPRLHDFPGEELLDALAEAVEGMVGRMAAATGFDIVGYGEGPVARRAVETVTARLVLAGRVAHEACLVTSNHWAALPAVDCNPGRELRWIALASAGPEMQLADPDPHHGRFVPIPASTPARQAAALAVLAEEEPHDPERDLLSDLESWSAAIADDALLESDPATIRLAWSLRHKLTRDCVLMLAAWGPDAAYRMLAESLESPVPPRSWSVGAEPPTVLATFIGRGSEGPDEARVRRSIDVLRRVVEAAPASLAPPPLVLLAWLEWSRGRGSAAAGYLDACAAVEPDYVLARLFRRVVDSGRLPDWCGAR
ncbi:DUF4192 domain-containing protein [Herbiconiux sp. CPCC 203407]|uniref:DUF4192 domain-containing protein n=1 Tax=Herbiconiux oxytropis TaxID=2970915 RepID=A0AA41XDX0_9MICO|nr:DUF4192 domain-containing protein [Herbiconiux oxytropis]MCS5723487.1 DUF4192 domain-containing protein [Herbiconiux oxytropis]MCS5726406.1 DUF4192 domain-containing protein [Herbiconiux oxytropis]